jgi:TonB-dependent SusC/RagA subfamily outer membrane receptor
MNARILILFILLIPFCTGLSAQKAPKKITISGTVTDGDQKPVAGAMVIIDNKKTDCLTDQKGFYKIKVKADASLISVFTMKNGIIDEPVNGRTVINFVYKTISQPHATGQATDKKNETVNVGYGTIKNSEMTTTVGKIDGQNKKYASYTNIYDMIRGEVPGVQVNGKTIQIQGPSSINMSSEPLFVVDGMVVTSIDDIRPQQVKSIEILKGPSASIYGSRGSNGVILITLVGAEKKK